MWSTHLLRMLAAILVAALVACEPTAAVRFPRAGVPASLLASPPPESELVSFLQVIARSEAFDGKPIRVVGFLHLEFEGQALYLHREDYEHLLLPNSVWVDVPLQSEFTALNDQYVVVEGVFRAKPKGGRALRSGTLENISLLDPVPSRAELERANREAR